MSAERQLNITDLPRYTIEDWKQWEGNWELIRGIPYAMSPAPNSDHQRLNGELWGIFRKALMHCGSCKVYLPVNLQIAVDVIVQPDLLVLCHGPERFNILNKKPNLVLEILSPSTATKDLNLKAGHYADFGIPYYVLVHPDEEWIRIQALKDEDWEVMAQFREGEFEFDFDSCKTRVSFSGLWG